MHTIKPLGLPTVIPMTWRAVMAGPCPDHTEPESKALGPVALRHGAGVGVGLAVQHDTAEMGPR